MPELDVDSSNGQTSGWVESDDSTVGLDAVAFQAIVAASRAEGHDSKDCEKGNADQCDAERNSEMPAQPGTNPIGLDRRRFALSRPVSHHPKSSARRGSPAGHLPSRAASPRVEPTANTRGAQSPTSRLWATPRCPSQATDDPSSPCGPRAADRRGLVEAEHGAERLIDGPHFVRRQVPNATPEPLGIHCTDLFDEHPSRVSSD